MRWLLVAVGCAGCGRGFFNPMPAQHDAPIAMPDGPAGPIAYVQSTGLLAAASSNEIDVPTPLPQRAGDANLVVVFWENASVTKLGDTRGNTYTTAIGPITGGNTLSETIFYATDIAAGQNSVHVELSSAPPVAFGVAIIEYAGVAGVDPIDNASGTEGASSIASSGELDLASDGDLVVAAITTDNVVSLIPGFTLRENANGVLVEDLQTLAAGPYAAITQDAVPDNWVCEAVGLRR